ncbi:MAG: DEAD/DEAH box helicase family protein [Ruminococcus sp.]|nr:DEAD/DEAH box helicase family protein [Ruminococcus sp.]
MKTLILNGILNSRDDSILNLISQNLTGEYKIIDLYSLETSQLITTEKNIDKNIQTCNSIIMISSIVFGTLSGRLIEFASRYINSPLSFAPKIGLAVFVSNDGDIGYASSTAKSIMNCLNVQEKLSDVIVDNDTYNELSSMIDKINSKAENNVSDTIGTNAKITKYSSPQDKINLYRSLFKGREDVYALRWYNSKTEKSGYSPVCSNKWLPGVCDMPKVKCAECNYRSYTRLDDKAIYSHLSGKDALCRDVIGIYPMLPDETTNILVLDFDDEDWQKDAAAVREICNEHSIPCCVERSRSGAGAHLWIFFETPIKAAVARKLGSGILTEAMKKRHEISFSSYDRMFPSQDTMPSGGFGNLIALPLQKQAVLRGNSVFVDESYKPYPDQWAYLSCVRKLSEKDVTCLIDDLCKKSDLGELYSEEITEKPWQIKIGDSISEPCFPDKLTIIISNMIYIPKDGITQHGLNRIKRLASFKNPEFYKAQAMRMSTYGKPRIIALADENEKYIMLPRGCRESLEALLSENNSTALFEDKTVKGRNINVKFIGELHTDQQEAVSSLMKYDNGVIAATTAFGKTVTAIGLIAERKTSTLILVHTQALLQQWKKSLKEFLIINEVLPEKTDKRGRKKEPSVIGQLGGSKNTLTGIVDIAVMQSLYNEGEINPIVNDYGMIIVDECHHVSAFSFESILRETHAKFVYGLTATPKRSDGHQPIIFMQCGPIRYSADAKTYADKHSFEHILVPRFTKFRCTVTDKKLTITDIYKELSESESRNKLIVSDVKTAVESGRTPIIISERMSHIYTLSEMLKDSADNVILLSGQGTAKVKNKLIERVREIPDDQTLILLATGKYIGEGFDCPRLDTLFLAMPISWSGTLAQYAGRLHREYKGKSEVMIFDYIDINVHMLENMYKKRIRGYAKFGYAPKDVKEDGFRTIYTNDHENDLFRDITAAKKSVIVTGSYISLKHLNLLIKSAEQLIANGVYFKIVTRNNDSKYNNKIKEMLTFHHIEHTVKNKLNNSFAVIDGKNVWYSSGELFSTTDEDNCVLRIEDDLLAGELTAQLE